MPKLLIIIASTRPGRAGLPIGQWAAAVAKEHSGFEVEVADLAAIDLPLLDEPNNPKLGPYVNEHTLGWSRIVASADAFLFVTPEYNSGPSAVLKNAIDWVYPEWNRKAAAFVSYGSAMGARAVQQLRVTAVELQMAPVRSSVHIPVTTLWEHFPGRGRGQRPRQVGKAGQSHDRRSALVDVSSQSGPLTLIWRQA